MLPCPAWAQHESDREMSAQRLGTLLVPVPGLSGTTYPPGTTATVRRRGATVDACVKGDCLPLAWWALFDGLRTDIAARCAVRPVPRVPPEVPAGPAARSVR